MGILFGSSNEVSHIIAFLVKLDILTFFGNCLWKLSDLTKYRI